IRPERLAVQVEDGPAVEGQAALDPRTVREQPHDGPGRHRLPRAGLADEPERLARRDRQRHVVDHAPQLPPQREIHAQVLDVEQRGHLPVPAARVDSRSPSTLNTTTVSTIAPPAASDCCGYPLTSSELPLLTIVPQSTAGGWVPRPMNDSAAMSTNADAKATV